MTTLNDECGGRACIIGLFHWLSLLDLAKMMRILHMLVRFGFAEASQFLEDSGRVWRYKLYLLRQQVDSN